MCIRDSLGIDAESTGNRSIDLLEKVDGIDVFIDGHSHSTLEDVKAAAGGTGKVGDTLVTSTGTKLESEMCIRDSCTRPARPICPLR